MILKISSNRKIKKIFLMIEKLKNCYECSCRNLVALSKKGFATKTQVNRTSHSNASFSNEIITNKNKPWSVLFFGNDAFAFESLQKLESEYRLRSLLNRLEVVSSYKGEKNEVIEFSKANNLKIHQWPINAPIVDFDIGVVVSFGHLIPSSIIHSFPLGIINVHGSLLPRWRGAAPIVYSLLNGDTKTGITIMKIKPKKFDIGEIIAQETIDIGPDEMHPELHKRLSLTGADLLIKTIKKLPNILNEGISQSIDGVTYAPKITRDTSIIKWSEMNAKNVYNLQRALSEIYPLTSKFQGKVLKLHGIKMIDDSLQFLLTVGNTSDITPGLMIYDKQLNLLRVQCKDGNWISIEKVTLTNHKRMTAKEFNNGFIIKKLNKVILET